VLGREGERNDVGVGDPAVSGAHARVQVDGEGRLLATDLGSRNGTAVRRQGPFSSPQRLSPGVPCALEPGDELVLAGRVVLTTVAPAAPGSPGGREEPEPEAAEGGLLSEDAKEALEQAGRVLGTVGGALNTVVEGGRAVRARVDRVQATVQEGLDVLNGAADDAVSSWDNLRGAEQEVEEGALQEQRRHWTAGLLGGGAAEPGPPPEAELGPPPEAELGAPPAPSPAPAPPQPDAAPPPPPVVPVAVVPDEADDDLAGGPAPPEETQLVVPQMVSAESSLVVDEPTDLVEAASGLAERGDGGDFASSVQQALTGGMGGITNSQVQLNYKPTFVQGAGADETKDAKSALLTAILGLDRGLAASDEARKRVQKLACALEASNPTRNPLRSPLINGEWELQYTTCRAAVEGGVPGVKLRPVAGGIRQRVDMYSMKVVNESTYKLAFSEFTNVAVADLAALSDSRVQLKFSSFKIGPLQMSAPPRTPARLAIEWELSATGRGGSGAWLDTTYVDYDLRLGRNDMGDLFILSRID